MSRIDQIGETFQSVDTAVRLELLLEYADRLPLLPPEYLPLRDAGMNLVHECQSPVFLVVDVVDGRVRVYGDVPREAPTARGFTALLVDAFDGASPDDVRAAPPDLLAFLGLARLLGMQRTRGLSAIYARVRNEVARRTGDGHPPPAP